MKFFFLKFSCQDSRNYSMNVQELLGFNLGRIRQPSDFMNFRIVRKKEKKIFIIVDKIWIVWFLNLVEIGEKVWIL